MQKSILDLEREILALDQQKLNIEIKLWNARRSLLTARTHQAQVFSSTNDPIPSRAVSQGQVPTANVTQNDVRPAQISSQSQENDNSRSTESDFTPQPHTVPRSISINPGSGDRYETLVNNQHYSTSSTQPHQAHRIPKSLPPTEAVSPNEPSSSSLGLEQPAQINAPYAHIGMFPSASYPVTAVDNLRSQQMPPPPILSLTSQQAALSPHHQPSHPQQRPIAAPSPRQGATSINPFLHYGPPNSAAFSPRPSTQRPGLFPDDTPENALYTSLSGRHRKQRSPSSTQDMQQQSQSLLGQEAPHTPITDTFSFYTGSHGSRPNPALEHDFASADIVQPLPSTSRNASGLGKGLTRKPKDVLRQSRPQRDSNSSAHSENTLQRKRTPSIEITDQRPRQRLRSEDSRVMTPPLNDRDNVYVKSEDEAMEVSDLFSGFKQAEPGQSLAVATIDEYNATPPPTRPHRSGEEPHDFDTVHRPQQAWQPPKGQISNRQAPPSKSNTAEFLRSGDEPQINRNSGEDAPISPDQQQRRRRQASGTPALIAEASQNIPDIDSDAPRPARPRKPQGAYKTAEYKPLNPAERQDLEKRFCCQVAKIIGSKICVNMPPVPFDNVRIFDRLRERLLGKNSGGGRDQGNEGEENAEKYRTWTDFQNDARRMLQDYVKLGQCEGCPFETTGNARVMCYRMRLTSILDARMREIKQCMHECELDLDASDWEGRRKKIDTWFAPEDFQEAGHDAGR